MTSASTAATMPRGPIEANLITFAGLQRKLRGLTTFRIVVVTCLLVATALVGIGPLVGLPAEPFTRQLNQDTILYGTIAAVYGLSLIYGVALRLARTDGALKRLAYTQLGGDVLFASILVLLTGGTGSVFTFFFSLTIVNAAIILYRSGAVFTATCCFTIFLVIALQELGILDLGITYPGHLSSLGSVIYNLVVNGVAFYAIALLGSYLAEQLRRSDIKLEKERLTLEDLRALHEDIVASIPAGLVTVNQARQVTFFNQVAEEITGMSQGDVLFQDITRYFVDLRPIFSNEDKLESHHEELTCQVLKGQVTYLKWTISPLRDARDIYTGHTLIFEDVTSVRAMEDQMKRAQQFATLGKLASVIAHEIRNPLASISGAIQLLRSTLPLDDDDMRLMDIIGRETDVLSQWISDFLTYARPRPGERVKVNLSLMLEEALVVLKADEKLANIVCEFDGPSEAHVLADPTYIKQIFWNLLNNATQAMTGGGRLNISIEAVETTLGRFHRMRFSDTGVGILPELRERVFEPFFTTKEKGTGLGLPTVHRVVTEHHGTIVLDSEAGTGTTFIVDLPVFAGEPQQEVISP